MIRALPLPAPANTDAPPPEPLAARIRARVLARAAILGIAGPRPLILKGATA